MRRPLSGDGLMSTGFGDLKVFSGSAHPSLTKEIADFLGIPVGQARLRRFPDSEVSFQIDENIRGADVFIIQPTSNPVDQHLMEMLVMIDAFRRSSRSASRGGAVLRYARRTARQPRCHLQARATCWRGRTTAVDDVLHKARFSFLTPMDHLSRRR